MKAISSLGLEAYNATVAQDLLERRWFAAQAATRGLQAECDLLLEALNLAEAASQRARNQLAEFQAMSDALEAQLTAMDLPTNAVPQDRRVAMSAA
jgi:hypothetical protein